MNLAVNHLIAAAAFSRNVGEIEIKHLGQSFGPFYDDILSNSIATVLCAVASIEAYVNEVLIHDKRLQTSELKECAWAMTRKTRILEKYDGCLRLLQCKPIPKGKFPHQDAQVLISLRNALTHFIPEGADQQSEHAALSKKLRTKLKPPSPFFSRTELIFPKAWATHSCTIWAVRSAKSMAELFEEHAGIPKRIAMFDSRLNG